MPAVKRTTRTVRRGSNRLPKSVGLRKSRAGFTLIEMLVSVALVLLMMVLFSQIFSMAGTSMTLQRAIADNDQQVRSFSTIMRSDWQKRTFRRVIPFDPLEDIDFQTVPYSDRQGYIYFSLNDPDNAVDNYLQFTVNSTINLENGDDTAYFGRASGLVQLDPPVSAAQAQSHVRRNWQQPEHDDGELQFNYTGGSTAAEIAYFVRGGRLYRRVVMVRDPLSVAGSHTDQPRMTLDVSVPGPSGSGVPEANPIEYFRHNVNAPATPRVQTFNGQYGKLDSSVPAGYLLSDDYWRDFDYSAYLQRQDPTIGWTAANWDGAEVVGLEALSNANAATIPSLGLTLGTAAYQTPPLTPLIATRCYRFGFDEATGISREFSHADPAAPGFFFLGRYTLEEMSHTGFNYPQNPIDPTLGLGGPNPFSYAAVPALADTLPPVEPDGVVDVLVNGARRGEDLLLSNVHAFEVDVWDDRIGEFLPVGHDRLGAGGVPGDYHRARNRQLNAGLVIVPGSAAAWSNPPYDRWTGRIFDTWHPGNDVDGVESPPPPAADVKVPPPYRALTFYPPSSPVGPYANRGAWAPATAYNVGDVVFPDYNRPHDSSYYYVCITAGTSGAAHEDADGDGVLDAGEDANMDMALNEDEPQWLAIPNAIIEVPPGSTEPRWQAVLNVRPLRAIRIRVRFLHVASNQMRQLSLVHSLID